MRRTPTTIMLRALRVIMGKHCHKYTTGIGACFRTGHTIGAEYLADRACDACIAHRAIELAKGK